MQEILNLEKRFWSAMSENDFENALDLTDFPCVLASSRGTHSYDQQEFKKMFEAGQGKIKDFQFDDSSVEIRQLSPDTAVIAYKIKSTFSHEGTDKTIEAVDTSTWVKRGDKWTCAMHTETELPAAKH